MALFNSMVQLCVPIEMEHVSLAGMGTPGKPQPIVQAAVGSELKPPGIVMPHTESETRKKNPWQTELSHAFSVCWK